MIIMSFYMFETGFVTNQVEERIKTNLLIATEMENT